jgi:pimeloyl-ACP methyl ester carboxylesterase
MMRRNFSAIAAATILFCASSTATIAMENTSAAATLNAREVVCRTVDVDGVKIFYREAGRPSSPTLVLLHGFPSSSFAFRDLIPRLSSHFHVLAPDYPGYGYSDTPPPGSYSYTFDHLAQTTDAFLAKVGVTSYILYMHDYGGPVGFRIATAHPERIRGLIIQNANAYEEGLNPQWRDELKDDIKNGGHQRAQAAQPPQPPQNSPDPFGSNLKWIQGMYTTGARDPSTMTRDGYTFDAAMLSRPGQDPIQDAIGDNYYTNVLLYPQWQTWLRQSQPRTLIVWGEGDQIFNTDGAKAYKRDVPKARLVFFNGGHFLLEEHAAEVAREITDMFALSPVKK